MLNIFTCLTFSHASHHVLHNSHVASPQPQHSRQTPTSRCHSRRHSPLSSAQHCPCSSLKAWRQWRGWKWRRERQEGQWQRWRERQGQWQRWPVATADPGTCLWSWLHNCPPGGKSFVFACWKQKAIGTIPKHQCPKLRLVKLIKLCASSTLFLLCLFVCLFVVCLFVCF